MQSSPPVSVLILARCADTAGRWAAMLAQPGWHIATSRDTLAADQPLDLLLTDRNPAEAALPPGQTEPIGVVRIGTSGLGDVHLPEGFAPRELRLACTLLAEITRLRRRQQAGSAAAQRLAHEALTDPLTGLANRRAWDETLRDRLATLAAQRHWLCVAIVDLDHFKRVNDTQGHPAGDEILKRCAEAFRAGLRQDDFVARLGGDEFGLLLWVADAASAAMVVDRVRRSLPHTASAGYTVEEGTSGAGRGTGEEDALPSPDDLFAAADGALRTAKEQGRDRCRGGEDAGGKSLAP